MTPAEKARLLQVFAYLRRIVKPPARLNRPYDTADAATHIGCVERTDRACAVMADAPDNHVTDDEGVERIADDPDLEVFVGDEDVEAPFVGDGPPGRYVGLDPLE